MDELNSDELIFLTELLHQHRGESLDILQKEIMSPEPDVIVTNTLVKLIELNKSVSKKLLGE